MVVGLYGLAMTRQLRAREAMLARAFQLEHKRSSNPAMRTTVDDQIENEYADGEEAIGDGNEHCSLSRACSHDSMLIRGNFAGIGLPEDC